jgi:hypothetical protein
MLKGAHRSIMHDKDAYAGGRYLDLSSFAGKISMTVNGAVCHLDT